MTTFAYNQKQSSLIFAEYNAMTKDEFVAYAAEYLFGEGVECLFENICQCQSEINAFGDSGPGTMLRLREQVESFNKVADRFSDITGEDVDRPRMPHYPVSYDDFYGDNEY